MIGKRGGETVLITGGAGFLGSHLCDLIISKDLRVVCVDNLLTGDIRNISQLLENENFTFLKADIT